MNKQAFNKNKYSVYCREHLKEFKDELRDDASSSLRSWPGRSVALLLSLSALATYADAISRDNPAATLALLTYAFPIALVIAYPLLTLLASTIEKYSPIAIDLLCFSSLVGYVLTIQIALLGAVSPEELESLFARLTGQASLILLLITAFSFHADFRITLIRNIVFSMTLGLGLYMINQEYFSTHFVYMQIIQGFLSGSLLVAWLFYESIRARFYLRSTDANTRQHLYNQLSKLVYPHQLERIKLGDELENTMPLKEGKAIVNVFDVQRSGEIRHEKTQEFFMGVFQSFLQICMKGYEHTPLRSRAFRLKETGDGFISSIGYPFLPIDSRSLADSAVSTALTMFEAFNVEVARFNYSRPIKAAMGLAYNSVQGTFQSGGIRSYDLFGDALIQAAKYEELRKHPVMWKIITEHANSLGLKDFHILVVQEVVYNSLSPSYRGLFEEVDLKSDLLASAHFQMMYDHEASYIYFHVLE